MRSSAVWLRYISLFVFDLLKFCAFGNPDILAYFLWVSPIPAWDGVPTAPPRSAQHPV